MRTDANRVCVITKFIFLFFSFHFYSSTYIHWFIYSFGSSTISSLLNCWLQVKTLHRVETLTHCSTFISFSFCIMDNVLFFVSIYIESSHFMVVIIHGLLKVFEWDSNVDGDLFLFIYYRFELQWRSFFFSLSIAIISILWTNNPSIFHWLRISPTYRVLLRFSLSFIVCRWEFCFVQNFQHLQFTPFHSILLCTEFMWYRRWHDGDSENLCAHRIAIKFYVYSLTH